MLASKPDSAGHLLWLVRTGRGLTRGDLQSATGLSRSAVVQRLDVLHAAGLIRIAGVAASTGGRPAQRLEFNPLHGVVFAAGVDADHARAAVIDVGGRILAEETARVRAAEGPERVSSGIDQCFEQLLAVTGWKPDQVRGIAVGAPAGIDREDIAERLRAGWDCPVYADGEANLMALGEHSASHPDCSMLVLVSIGTTIGVGMVLSGTIHQGAGRTDDIAHVRLPALAESACECGARGCLAAGASGGAIARRLTMLGVPTQPGSELVDRLRSGQADAIRLVRDAGSLLGESLGPALCVLGPGVLVVTGGLAGTPFLAGLREALHRAAPRTTSASRITVGRLGSHALLVGAHKVVVDQVYSPAVVDARLADGLS